jgi:AbiV family abortive infection protein
MKLLTQYRGFLTCEQIATGMTAAAQNASRLAEDAGLLLQAGRFPTACSLAILSLEESGKATILRSMATANTQEEILGLWKSYRRHLDKHLLTLMPDRVVNGARRLTDFRDCVNDDTLGERATYDAVKQLGFYTDCLGNAHWSIPIEVIDEKLARSLVTTAKVLSEGKHTVTVREHELWVTHIQNGNTRQNLLAWAKAMEFEGLHPEGYLMTMSRFTEGL